VIRTEEEHLAHYGIKRRSGRYPWGSGGDPQHSKSFLDTVKEQRKQGLSEAQIAKSHGMTTSELRARKSIENAQQKQEKILTAQRLKDKGWSNVEIGRRMGLNESSVRALLVPGEKEKASAYQTTANMLKDQLAKKEMVDVGVGVERHLGVTQTHLNTAVDILKEEGYTTHNIQIQQLGTGKYTTMKVLAEPGTTLEYVQRNRGKIQQISDYSDDYGRSYFSAKPPLSVNSRRIAVNYGAEGAKADGMIYVRPGVSDLRIGNKRYGQVRIKVDDTHYLKGMAVYKDDLPVGKDLVFNTKQPNTGRKKDALKELSSDSELPFGAVVRQIHDKDGNVISAINLVGSPTKEGSGEEGSWDTWSRNLSAQMLSKQSPKLIKQQLGVTSERRFKEFDEINSLTNPTVRKDLLLKFADQTDAAAVHLKAASLPRQATKVLIPVSSMKPTEIYAPGFRDGEKVVLIRYPHGGTFEIPELTVNTRNREAQKILGKNPQDAVGIHHKVAERLSGADFDGDTVLVIPNNNKSVESTPALEGLKGFDPMVYKIPKNSPIAKVTDSRKQSEMGNVSNLITDMTLGGANTEQLSRAIRHSMVVIDSEKHQLDFKQSEKDHGILALKEEYQGGKKKGAATLISRKKSPIFLPQMVERPARQGGPIDPVTGKKVFVPTGRMIPEKKYRKDPVTGKKVKVATGAMIPKKERYQKLAITDDAFTLSSGTQIESIYAEHSNKLKALANVSRKEAIQIKPNPYSKSAKKVYANEVDSLNAKLNVSLKNAPLERQAQLLANTQVSMKRQSNPHMEDAEVKKIRQHALNESRIRTGAKKTKIIITPTEWEAIQAGAISTNKLEKILANSDMDTVKALALPKHTPKLTPTKLARANAMLADGYTQQEVADHLGIGLTTLKVGLNG
jgi:hypothetical protein